MNKVIVYIVFFISNIVLAQDAAQVIFEKANENYRKEQYQAAAEQYESILEKQKVASAELYYNLGNCYYKLGK
ncbi:hypothetical protein [Flavobacterium sediminis]|uniref:hypothetical protein n=1 Tax=Flavobacterium sediminis TaxID=2201181 RepID=UPI00267C36C2|nr:hypothetical protein [Flavobacterium sediminis]